jgi:metal-responsive CopG/Arc/MetJ family transcriptional regulator
MKIAISLPTDLFEAAESLAAKLGVSRSRLVAMALGDFIAKQRSAKVTERLDAVYAADESRVEPALRRAQKRAADRTKW